MQVKGIAECSKHSAILSTSIKLPFFIKTFDLSIFEWSFKTGFTVFTSWAKNSVDPNHLTLEASWSESALFLQIGFNMAGVDKAK